MLCCDQSPLAPIPTLPHKGEGDASNRESLQSNIVGKSRRGTYGAIVIQSRGIWWRLTLGEVDMSSRDQCCRLSAEDRLFSGCLVQHSALCLVCHERDPMPMPIAPIGGDRFARDVGCSI
jgi:hypothetical protein